MFPYKICFTDDELDALAYLSGRYESAKILFVSMESDENIDTPDNNNFVIPEHVAWEFQGACAEEDGGITPCCSPELENKLRKLLNSIV